MSSRNSDTIREQSLDQIVESGLYGVLAAPTEPSAPSACFFSLAESADLVVLVDDVFTGESEYHVNFDRAVDELLNTFAEEPPQTWDEKMEDILTLRKLALRFHAVAARLASAAQQREFGLGLRNQLIG